VEISLQMIRSGGSRVVAVARDITARKLAEIEREHIYNEAVAAVRARDDFLSVASHELRGPLSALELRLEALIRMAGNRSLCSSMPAEQFHDRLCAALAQADRLAHLVGELLEVSRIVEGQLHLDLREVDLTGIARDVVARFREPGGRAGSTIALHAAGPVVGHWDAMRLQQVMTHLISNAVKFGAGKPIDVSVSTDGRYAHLAVRDHGIGVAPEDVDRIFHRFERTAAARAYDGLGMGLYMVRQIVEAHGGKIRVESGADAGSTFVADLPLDPIPEKAGPAPPDSPGERGGTHGAGGGSAGAPATRAPPRSASEGPMSPSTSSSVDGA
jgi:signal transduction histidine kinase